MPAPIQQQHCPSQRQHQWILRGLSIIYGLSGLSYLLFPDEIFNLINFAQRVTGIGEAIPPATERFWLVHTLGEMTILSVLSILGARFPTNAHYIWAQVFSLLVTSAGFLFMLFQGPRYFAYAAGLLTDLSLASLLTWSWIRMNRTAKNAKVDST